MWSEISFDELPSTHEWAVAHLPTLLKKNVPVRVTTANQTAGVGRGGKPGTWIMRPGDVAATFVFVFENTFTIPLLSFVTANAVIRCLDSFVSPYGQAANITLKWVNDILYDGAKISGILCSAKPLGKDDISDNCLCCSSSSTSSSNHINEEQNINKCANIRSNTSNCCSRDNNVYCSTLRNSSPLLLQSSSYFRDTAMAALKLATAHRLRRTTTGFSYGTARDNGTLSDLRDNVNVTRSLTSSSSSSSQDEYSRCSSCCCSTAADDHELKWACFLSIGINIAEGPSLCLDQPTTSLGNEFRKLSLDNPPTAAAVLDRLSMELLRSIAEFKEEGFHRIHASISQRLAGLGEASLLRVESSTCPEGLHEWSRTNPENKAELLVPVEVVGICASTGSLLVRVPPMTGPVYSIKQGHLLFIS